MIALIAIFLLPMGFYDSVSQANDKSDARLDATLVEMIALSERKTKHNINKIGTLSSGLTLYSFQYHNDKTTYIGLMADELAKHQAFKSYVVHMGEGSYMINYEKLGLQQITLETWEKEGLTALQTSTEMAAKKGQVTINKSN